jgi:hypothetical protein
MWRYVRWSWIFLLGLLLFVAATSPTWLEIIIVQPEGGPVALGFQCPLTFQPEVCEILLQIDEENPAEAEAMVAALQGELIPAPSNEADPGSVESEIDQEAISAFSNTLIRTGRFEEINFLHRAEGQVNVYELVADGVISRYLRFENDFQVGRGPDLRVYLSISESPRTAEEVLANDTAVELALLKGNRGGQNYPLPIEVDITLYRSVVIYSPDFGRVFSTAPLNQPLR